MPNRSQAITETNDAIIYLRIQYWLHSASMSVSHIGQYYDITSLWLFHYRNAIFLSGKFPLQRQLWNRSIRKDGLYIEKRLLTLFVTSPSIICHNPAMMCIINMTSLSTPYQDTFLRGHSWCHDRERLSVLCLHYWPFVRGIHQSLVDSPHKGPLMLRFNIFTAASLNKL